MALSDGDLFVSGSILSYQQANRIYQNFRGATVPTALQAGALFSDSDDDKLHHQGASELLEVFTEKTILTWENILPNTGVGVWSQSDASKGLATITYDTGDKGAGSAPSVGDAVVGANGGTAKLISYTTATGAWADGDATGVLTVGAVSHDFAFVDNEILTFGGVETAAVNMADSAVQVGLVQNGGFADIGGDPPPGWNSNLNAVLTTEAGGQVGNCMQVEIDGVPTANGRAISDVMTTVVGKIYKATIYFKKGTGTGGKIRIGVTSGSAGYYDSGSITDVAWTAYTKTFEATGTTVYITLYADTADGAGLNSLYDEVTLYEITPCCTAGDALAMDGWNKDTTLDIYREHQGSNTKDGSFYALKLVPHTALDFVKFPGTYFVDSGAEEHYQKYQQRTVTFGAWVKTSKASHVRLAIYDGSYTYSSYHTGGGTMEWLEVTDTIGASATDFQIRVICAQTGEVGGATIVYVSQAILVFGSHIGEGNYQPKPQEFIWLEVKINSNLLNNSLGLSDELTFLDINLEADSDGKLPKSAKTFYLVSYINDSGSAGTDWIRLQLRDAAGQVYQYVNSVGGITNDYHNFIGARQKCNPNGDFQYSINASGANTFDIGVFYYLGVQVN